MPFIEIRKLSKRYSDGFMLDDISFSMDRGEILTLMGPSGSGKTSLLRNICGLDRPNSGVVIVDGIDLTRMPVQKRNIGMIFQDLALFPHMTVFANMAYGLRSKRIPETEVKRKVEEIAGMLGIGDLLDRYPSEISGGERQRVALARSVLPDPKLLLLDEPMGSLDIPLRSLVRAEIKEFAKKTGLTMIYVTHDHHEGFFMADKAGIVTNGRLDAIENPTSLFMNPETTEKAAFLGYNIINLNGRTYGIHPRDLKIARNNPDFTATILAAGFEGDMDRISISTADGEVLQAWLPPGTAESQVSAGAEIGFQVIRRVELS